MAIQKTERIKTRLSEGTTISVFAKEGDAQAHLCDHVLTPPEAQHWAVLIINYAVAANPQSDSSLHERAASLWNDGPNDVDQALYEGYAEQIGYSVDEGLRWGWYWSELGPMGRRWFALGTSGIYVIWNKHTIVTGMLPAWAKPRPRESSSWFDRKSNPRPRATSETSLPLVTDDKNKRYQIFKDCFTCVRREYIAAYNERRVESPGTQMQSQDVIDQNIWNRLRRPSR